MAIKVAVAIEADKADAIDFVNRAYLITYQSCPPIADYYVVARDNGQIVGCIGLELAKEGLLPLERLYGIQRNLLPFPLDEENGVQFGRWVVGEGKGLGLSKLLLYEAAAFAARKQNKKFGLVEHNQKVHRLARLLGIDFWDIPCAQLNPDLYQSDPTRPQIGQEQMKPYLVNLQQVVSSLDPQLSL